MKLPLAFLFGMLLLVSGCDQPGEPVGSLKKPFDFGIKPDSVPSSEDQNNPIAPSEDEELSKKEGITRICVLEPGFRGQKTGYFIMKKPGRLRAVVTSDYSGPIEAIVKVALTTPNPDAGGLPNTHIYNLRAGLLKNATTQPYSNLAISAGWAEVRPYYDITCDLERRDYPIEVQFIEGQ